MREYEDHTDEIKKESRPEPVVIIHCHTTYYQDCCYVQTVPDDPIIEFHDCKFRPNSKYKAPAANGFICAGAFDL